LSVKVLDVKEDDDDPKVAGHSIRFIADKSFFHDVFRTDYDHQDESRWMSDYLFARNSIKPNHKLMITPSSIIGRLRDEIGSHGDIQFQTMLTVEAITEIYPYPNNENLKFAPIYLAKTIFDFGFIPVIISSVSGEKWLERAHKVGMIQNEEEFTKNMSIKRLDGKMWFVPANARECTDILKDFDNLYQKVTSLLK
jgi:hypothetical protein